MTISSDAKNLPEWRWCWLDNEPGRAKIDIAVAVKVLFKFRVRGLRPGASELCLWQFIPLAGAPTSVAGRHGIHSRQPPIPFARPWPLINRSITAWQHLDQPVISRLIAIRQDRASHIPGWPNREKSPVERRTSTSRAQLRQQYSDRRHVQRLQPVDFWRGVVVGNARPAGSAAAANWKSQRKGC